MTRKTDSARTFWWIGGVVAALGLVGVGLYVFFGGAPADRGSTSGGEEVSLVSHEGQVRADGSLVVTGRVRNTSNRTHTQVKVAINLYDDGGAQIGSTTATADELGPGTIWEFEAVVASDSAARYEIDRVTWR